MPQSIELKTIAVHSFNLQRYTDQRLILLQSLYSDPKSFSQTLYLENNDMLSSFRSNTPISSLIPIDDPRLCCLVSATCGHSTKIGQGKMGQVFRIIDVVPPLTFKIQDIGNLSARYILGPFENYGYTGCIFQSPFSILACDDFTNEMLISYILDHIYTESGDNMKGYTKTMIAGICTNVRPTTVGVNIMEDAQLGDLLHFIESRSLVNFDNPASQTYRPVHSAAMPDILDIIKQIATNLDFVQSRVYFNHGDLKVLNILVSRESSRYQYNGVSVDSDVTYKLADFSKSALTIRTHEGSLRIFNENPLANKYLKLSPFHPKIYNNTFVINDLIRVGILAKIRHTGLPYYMAMDWYTFMISLMLIPQVFRQIMTTELKQLWDILWIDEKDANTVYQRIFHALDRRMENRYMNVITILRGLHLRCDALTLTLNLLVSF